MLTSTVHSVSVSCHFFCKISPFVLTEEDNPGKWIHLHPQMRDLAYVRIFTLVKYPPAREVCMMS